MRDLGGRKGHPEMYEGSLQTSEIEGLEPSPWLMAKKNPTPHSLTPNSFTMGIFTTKTRRIFIFREWGEQRVILGRSN